MFHNIETDRSEDWVSWIYMVTLVISLFSYSDYHTLDLPPTQDASHHQDYYIFSRKSL